MKTSHWLSVAFFGVVLVGFAIDKIGTHGESNISTSQKQSFSDLLTSGAWSCGNADYTYEALYLQDGTFVHHARPQGNVELLAGGTWRVEGQNLIIRSSLGRFVAAPTGPTAWVASAKGQTVGRSNDKTVVSSYTISGKEFTLTTLQWINWDGNDKIDFKNSEAKPVQCHRSEEVESLLRQARNEVPAMLLPTQAASQPVVNKASASAQSVLPSFVENEGYAAVRQKMLAAGWQPFHAPDADVCSAGDGRCQGRPEMQACAGTGMANCRFLWQRDGKTIAVMTVGEDAAYSGIEQVGGAVSANFEGIVVAPREQGEQYALRMTTSKLLAGDADCGQQQKSEIELWDQPSKLQPYVGKSVSVVGQLDCPRGGYVLRSVTISAR